MKLGRSMSLLSCLYKPGLVAGVVCAALLWAIAPAEAARLSSWRFNPAQNQLELLTDGDTQPKAQLLFNPTRLVIDLPGVELGRSTMQERYGGAIQSIRVAQFDRDTTRLVIELAPGYTLDPNQVKFRGLTAQQWVVSLPQPQMQAQTLVQTRPVVPATPVQTTGGQSPVMQPTWTPPNPVPRSVPNGRAVVMIDPGHGGPDPGAVGIGGLQEKGVVLDISRQVAGLLQQQGVQAVLTRADDRDLDLEPRVQMAEQTNATVFVSIHANAISMSRPDVNGLETYYHQSGGQLAQTIHQNVLQATGASDRGVRQARFYVLRKTSMPSVLVEVGFVTGQEDATRLSNPAYRSQMAVAIARGILQYLQQTAKL